MNVLIAYATNTSSTMMAAQTVADTLTSLSHAVSLKTVLDTTVEELGNYDLIVLASPSWDFEGQDGMPHEWFIEFMKKAEGQSYAGKKFAILGLGDSSYTHFCGAVEHLEAFVTKTGGVLAAPSMKIDRFFENQDTYTQQLTDWATTLSNAVSKNA